MAIIRTPEPRFRDLPDYPFEPRFVQLGETRMHYIDQGQGQPILLLHGEPTWSYLYRHIVRALQDDYRLIAPDLIGFGKSDKYTEREAYSFAMHCEKIAAFIEAIDLREVTLVVHDWGGPIGLWTAVMHEERFARLVVLNTFLSTGRTRPNLAFRAWRAFARYSPIFPVGQIVQTASVRRLDRAEVQAYDAPFPGRSYKAGARVFPLMVPSSRNDLGASEMRQTFRALRRWEKPTLVMFSDKDPILGGLAPIFRHLIPGTAGQPEITVHNASHFLQEDKGPEIADHIDAFIRRS